MNIIEKKVKKHVEKFRRQDCQRDKGEWYPYQGKIPIEYKSRNRNYKKMLVTKEQDPSLLCGWSEEMAYWHALQVKFMRLCGKGDALQQQNYLALAAYLYFLQTITSKYIASNEAGLYNAARAMALCGICGWDREVDRLGENMISSINHEIKEDSDEYGSSIGHGDEFCTHTHSWMILDLYCLSKGRHYNTEHAKREKNLIPYDEVLLNWNTKDLKQVDQLCYKLAEAHIENHVESDSFEAIEMWPYEVEAWFYFRARSGLDNLPYNKLSHPLFHQAMAQSFIEKPPLPYPYIEGFGKLIELYDNEWPEDKIPKDLVLGSPDKHVWNPLEGPLYE